MEKWTKLQENIWFHETALVCVSLVRAREGERWRAMVSGRNLSEVRVTSVDLRIAKATATRFAKTLLRGDLGEL